jgi:hypothetical protein
VRAVVNQRGILNHGQTAERSGPEFQTDRLRGGKSFPEKKLRTQANAAARSGRRTPTRRHGLVAHTRPTVNDAVDSGEDDPRSRSGLADCADAHRSSAASLRAEALNTA